MNDDTRTSRWLPLLSVVLAAGCGDRATDDGYTFEFCADHRVQTATCTGGLCDPAPFTKCDDGSCVLEPEQCPGEQPSPTFEYCEAGQIKTATCDGGICDPAPFEDCGDGSCALLPETCPDEPPDNSFTYCEDGKIKTATCEGGICDPAPFEDCGDGSCALSPEACPATAAVTYEQLSDPTRVVACSDDADCCVAFDSCRSTAFVINAAQQEAVDALIDATEHEACCACGYPAVWVGCEGGHCVGRRVLGSMGFPNPDGSTDPACDGFFGGCFDPLPAACSLGETVTSFITNYT